MPFKIKKKTKRQQKLADEELKKFFEREERSYIERQKMKEKQVKNKLINSLFSFIKNVEDFRL
jgi:hypothetical protein